MEIFVYPSGSISPRSLALLGCTVISGVTCGEATERFPKVAAVFPIQPAVNEARRKHLQEHGTGLAVA